MESAGASPTLRAAGRLLGRTVLVALLALAMAAGSARAQVAPPPGVPTEHMAPGAAGDGWDEGHEWDDDFNGRAQPQPHPRQPYHSPLPDNDHGLGEDKELPPVTTSYVAGRVARLRTDGKAAIPRSAPKRVRALIAQYNRIVGKRYKWGGGHAKLVDSGYDCSGAVGYGLIKGGLLRTTMVSGSFARWGAAGAGRWVTVYAHASHVYVEVAGLRLDTSSIGDRGERSGVRWRPAIGQRRGFKARHPVGL